MNGLVIEIQETLACFAGGRDTDPAKETVRTVEAMEAIRGDFVGRVSTLETRIRNLPYVASKRDWTRHQQTLWVGQESTRLHTELKALQTVLKAYLS